MHPARRSKPTLLVAAPVLALVALVACSSREEKVGGGAGIVNGEADTQHEAVVAVLSDRSLCSGTIVKVDVEHGIGWVVTAAHCVRSAPLVAIRGSDFSDREALRYRVLDYQAHPDFVGEQGNYAHDFAVVRVTGVGANTPVIPLADTEDAIAVGDRVTSVGFGRTTVLEDAGVPQNTKRNAIPKELRWVTPSFVGFDMAEGGICSGDSGGPVLAGSGRTERVVGVHSYVQGGCAGRGMSGRVILDTAFFREQLAREAPSPSCDLCLNTATSAENECARKLAACRANADCDGFGRCLASSTAAACALEYPLGEGPYRVAANCACTTACADVCAGDAKCAGAPKCGVRITPSACTTCTEGACCEEQAACVADGQCFSCLRTHDANASRCERNRPRQALQACIASRCRTKCMIETAPPEKEEPEQEEALPQAEPEIPGTDGSDVVVTSTTTGCSATRSASAGSAAFGLLGFVGLALGVRRRRQI